MGKAKEELIRYFHQAFTDLGIDADSYSEYAADTVIDDSQEEEEKFKILLEFF